MSESNPPGRPTKRTPEARLAILDAIEDGCDLYTAAALGDMAYQTFNEWRKADPEFSDAVEKARAKAVKDRVDAVRNAMDADEKHWTAAAWWLERRRPKEWGKRDTVVVETPRLLWDWENDDADSASTETSGEVAETAPGTAPSGAESGAV